MLKTLLLVLFTMCVFPAIISAHSHLEKDPLIVQGIVYCDTCRCGYETELTKRLAGSVVRIECRSRMSSKITFTKEGVSDSTGQYQIPIHGDRGDDYCDVLLVKSSDPECSEPSSGRDRARVVLTRNNGMSSNTRFANPMGFFSNKPLARCNEVLRKYKEVDDQV